jgi:hypothetical protein
MILIELVVYCQVILSINATAAHQKICREKKLFRFHDVFKTHAEIGCGYAYLKVKILKQLFYPNPSRS